jgi:hypothetical protein
MIKRRRALRCDQPTVRGSREGCDGAFNLRRLAHVDWAHLHAQRWRDSLDRGELGGASGQGRIPENCHSRHGLRDLFEQLQPLCAQAIFEIREPGGVAKLLT